MIKNKYQKIITKRSKAVFLILGGFDPFSTFLRLCVLWDLCGE
jgi:hypothetical protein